jgi:hypothetical protein
MATQTKQVAPAACFVHNVWQIVGGSNDAAIVPRDN